MEKGLIGRKLGMTQVFSEEGAAVPVTVIEAGPCVVVQKKTREADGYEALQLGFGRKKQKRVTKPLQGHFRKADKGFFRVLREFKLNDCTEYDVGAELNVGMFDAGEYVDIIGTSKGRGFAGGVKRHGFKGGRASHGSMFHRAPGSIGASAYPSRVLKGKKLPGHMGDRRVTVQNLVVFGVRPDRNLLLVRGSVPGSTNGIVIVRNAVKKS
ncbi:MAG TPA: 50S ribosomal protein L3 [Syntrophales bacterium]|nr:50S ribosomal protein L3 [Syntrophales bacterium]